MADNDKDHKPPDKDKYDSTTRTLAIIALVIAIIALIWR